MSEMIKLTEIDTNLFYFKITLVSDKVDEDYDRFTTNSLVELSDMFIGRVGFLEGLNIMPKIFDTELVTDDFTLDTQLIALAAVHVYSQEDKESLIDFFSVPRVASISCNVNNRICSICGKETSICKHEKGTVYGKYNKRKCVRELSGVTNVYEWSVR